MPEFALTSWRIAANTLTSWIFSNASADSFLGSSLKNARHDERFSADC